MTIPKNIEDFVEAELMTPGGGESEAPYEKLKIMVSQPMSGVPRNEVIKRNQDALFNIALIYAMKASKKLIASNADLLSMPDFMHRMFNVIQKLQLEWITIVSAIELPEVPDASKLWYWGRDIQLMDEIDAIYFHWGYQSAKGCLIEEQVSRICEIPRMYATDLVGLILLSKIYAKYPVIATQINRQLADINSLPLPPYSSEPGYRKYLVPAYCKSIKLRCEVQAMNSKNEEIAVGQ